MAGRSCLSLRLASVVANMRALAIHFGGEADDALQVPLAELERIAEELEEVEKCVAKGGDRGGGRPSSNKNQRAGTVPLVSRKEEA